MISFDPFFSGDASAMQYSAIRQMAKIASQPGMISFAAGAPNADTFPVQEIAEVTSSLFIKDGKTALQYGLTLGFAGLAEAVLEFSTQKGIRGLDREQVAICS